MPKYPMAPVTVLQNIFKPDEVEYTFLFDVLKRIQSGASRPMVEQIRKATDPDTQQKLKMKLPCILFSGQFIKRANEAITHHNGYIILDFDDLPDPAAFRDTLSDVPFVYAAFISPSGTGVKCLVKIPGNKTAHRGHFQALSRYFADMGYKVDPSGKDVARICFESWDPDLYINPECDEFTGYEVPDETPPQAATQARHTDYGKLNICASMIRRAADGEKHNQLLKAARLAGGFIAAGQVREEDAIHVLESEVRDKPGVVNFHTAQKTIRDGIQYGKERPIYDHVPEDEPAPKTETTNGIRFLSGCWDEMVSEFKNGRLRGETTYMPDLDEHFTIKKGEVTVFTGYPNSGKSEFMLQMALFKSLFDGWKWAVFSPESYPEKDFYNGLIHAMVGKSVDIGYNNRMSDQQYAEAANFIQDHFFYIYPETAHTIEEVESNFDYCIKHHGVQGVIVDPYNQLSRDFSLRDDQYLEGFLTKRKRFSINQNIAYWMVVHPKGDRKKNKDGEYDLIGFYDLSGGAMWANKIDNLIVIRRPWQETDPSRTEVEAHVKKVKKQRLVGIPGMKEYTFSRASNRYYRFGKNPLDELINSDAQGRSDGKLKVA
ncbi:BT4734/BF3469 family protein [Larkinella soli]|uniref:BT4734/BF3469 family protein n=1 Tax=Larkinella soli TaxID=1770527 RepID=UPI000FFBA875|nr:BT4734/BF3469 family protein [Larkinella soli]